MSEDGAGEDFVRVAKTGDFAKCPSKSFAIAGKKVGVFKNDDGSFYAIEVTCRHQETDLTTGRIKNDIVTCPRHGWQYNIRTGECLTNASTPLRRYAVKVEGEDIYVSRGPVGD